MKRLRNRYYKGKPLKYEHFQLEQQYFNQHLQKLRSVFFGMGILYGLELKHKKGSKFKLLQGSAIDDDGQFIEIPNDLTLDIREIDGFQTLHNHEGYLTVTYDEDVEQDVIQESYHLKFEPTRQKNKTYDALFRREIIYNEHDLRIEICIPTFVCEQGSMQFSIHTYNQRKVLCTIKMDMKCNHYELMNGKDIDIHCDDFQQTFTYDIKRIPHTLGKKVSFLFHHTKLTFEHETIPIKDFRMQSVLCENLSSNVLTTLYQQAKKKKQQIYLGKIIFDHDEMNVLKIDYEERAYSYRPILYHQLEEILQRYGYHDEPSLIQQTSQKSNLNSGLYRFFIDEDETLYVSEEIQHGLGIGNVHIQLGGCYPSNQEMELCFGNQTLFYEKDMEVEMAARLWKEKGTFQIAIKLPIYHNIEYFDIVWYAQMYPGLSQEQTNPQLLRLRPTAITLSPFASFTFTPEFSSDVSGGDIHYRVCDEHGGTIDEEGTYYAPELPGIYQIEAQYEKEKVYAYVKVVMDG